MVGSDQTVPSPSKDRMCGSQEVMPEGSMGSFTFSLNLLRNCLEAAMREIFRLIILGKTASDPLDPVMSDVAGGDLFPIGSKRGSLVGAKCQDLFNINNSD